MFVFGHHFKTKNYRMNESKKAKNVLVFGTMSTGKTSMIQYLTEDNTNKEVYSIRNDHYEWTLFDGGDLVDPFGMFY